MLGKLCYYVFDIAFFNGEDLISNVPIKNRLKLMKDIFKLQIDTGQNIDIKLLKVENKLRRSILLNNYIGPIEIYRTDFNNDLELAKQLKFEGFVVLDVESSFGDKAYSFDGKAQRPDAIVKRKPKFEDEFVITGWYEGNGRNRGSLGGFYIKQIHPITNEWINCGKCGGGFSDEQRVEYWNEKEELIGTTIKVEFDSRQPPKDGRYALRFPEYKGPADKTPEECIAQFLEEEEE